MELGKQLKEYRITHGYSQEKLADKIYVSRQTISNWENDKSYPDIHNLSLLSILFDVSIDDLVKGDVAEMKQRIKNKKLNKEMNCYSWIMIISIVAAALSVGIPIAVNSKWAILIPIILYLPGLISSFKIERIKKQADIKTYSEIIAFTENGDVQAARSKRQPTKDFLSKTLIVILFAACAGVIALLSAFIFSYI